MLRQQYQDPYSYMMNEFGSESKAIDQVNNEGNQTLKCIFTVEFKLKQSKILVQNQFAVPSEEAAAAILYDGEETENKKMNNAIQIVNEKANELLKSKFCSDQKNIDDCLNALFENLGKKGINVTLPLSYGVISVVSQVLHQQPYEVMRQITGYKVSEDLKKNAPTLLVNLLQGSKLAGVKCKVYKFYLIIKSYDSAAESLDIARQVCLNIKKTITSGKQGEAALKFFNDGTFLCSVDTIADNIKQIEEAINKTPYKEKVALGISWMADNLFNPDKKLYELENPKQLLDTDQLIEYYFKLCNDKPIIEYMEDPINSDDNAGWVKMIKKFEGSKVKIGSRLIYKDLQSIKEFCEPLLAENYPDLSPEEIENKNQQRVHLNIAQFKPFEFQSFSKFTEVAKYLNSKQEGPCCCVISDNLTDTTDSSIVDLAFSVQNLPKSQCSNQI